MRYWLLREPTLCFGLPVYLCAAVIFPFQLGWTGASLLGFAAYLLLAAALFSIADAFAAPSFYPKWHYLIPQAFCSLLILVLPAFVAYSLAAVVAPIDEVMDDQVCVMRGGTGSSDTAASEADDAFDLTADCVFEPETREPR